MEFRFTPAQEAFRAEVREFIHAQLPPGWNSTDVDSDEAIEFIHSFQRALAKKGWLALGWPAEYGGSEADIITELVFMDEVMYWGAPGHNMGIAWVGPAIMLYGTDEQKKRYLPRIASGDDLYCTLYSEPDAGSDLAAIKTRAVLDGDEYVINGQKIWTSGGHHATYGWLAVRTDPDAPKREGISTFVIPMDTPGITIRPIINIAGQHHFNEVFFDDVRIHKDHLIGEPNRGWKYITSALEFERSGSEWIATAQRMLDLTVAYVREHPEISAKNPQVRYELAERSMEAEVGRMLCYRVVDMQARGETTTYEASVAKVYNSELASRVVHTAMKVFGPYSSLWWTDERAPLGGLVTHGLMNGFFWTYANTIGAGSSEVQRTIIASRGLGLSR
jgi:alkylation response protein AidB-like acyl-CoA dehydrogenase